MSSAVERAELQAAIWKIANDVRGPVEGWDFKQFVLGTLFYRFISENFVAYVEAGDPEIDYASMPDNNITEEVRKIATRSKGYFIYPSQLFSNVLKGAYRNQNLNTELTTIFRAIERSAQGYDSEDNIKGLFADVLQRCSVGWAS